MARVDKTPAYVLHCRPFTETSLLVDLFARQHGRITVLAKGARRPKNHQRAYLLPFRRLLCSWVGKGDLPILSYLEQSQYVAELQGNALQCGYYFNELLMRLLVRYDPHEALFDCYEDALAAINNDAELQIWVRSFEQTLLREIGFSLVLDCDAINGEVIDANAQYDYQPQFGPVRLGENLSERDLLQLCQGMQVSGSTLIDLAANDYRSARSRVESRQLCAWLIDDLLNRPLASRRILRSMRERLTTL